ncbi:MAG: hypothetical protein PHG14_10215 [Desulfobacter postgatei]|nr:hypothetical protein [Desulfobacter postgatei]
MDDENLFDEDDALDFVLYEEAEKELKDPKSSGGCLSVLIFFLVIPTGFLYFGII